MNNAQIASGLNINTDAQRRVSLILDGISKGSEEDITAPYTKDRSSEDILKGYDLIFQANSAKCNKVLTDLELISNRPKYGPMSKSIPWSERRESILDSFKSSETDRTFAPFDLTTPNRLRPISVPNAIGYLKNDSNSGLPTVTKKRNVKESFMGSTIDDLHFIVANYLSGIRTVEIACLLFTRTQELMKTRNIWGFSVIATLLEMCFYRPLLDIQSKQSWRSALRTPDDVSRAVTEIIDYALTNSLEVLSIDFRRFDNTAKRHLSDMAFQTIIRAFQPKYTKYLTTIRDFFVQCPIITPDGILSGEHGVPSGSTFTNEVDSIIQYGVSLECSAIAKKEISQAQGDDGLYVCYLASLVIKHFKMYGLDVSDEKSYVAKNWAIFLQSLFHEDYRDENGIINGIYPTYRALNRIIHLERFEDFSDDDLNGKDYFSIRTISILENCKHHPLFEEFVTYVWSLDKYRLMYSEQGLANYVRRLAIQEGKDITFRNWSYGSNISGLKSFECVKLINKLNGRV